MCIPHPENELLGWGSKHIILICSGKCVFVFKRLTSRTRKTAASSRKCEKHSSSAFSHCFFQRTWVMLLPLVKQSLFPVSMSSVVESCDKYVWADQSTVQENTPENTVTSGNMTPKGLLKVWESDSPLTGHVLG